MRSYTERIWLVVRSGSGFGFSRPLICHLIHFPLRSNVNEWTHWRFLFIYLFFRFVLFFPFFLCLIISAKPMYSFMHSWMLLLHARIPFNIIYFMNASCSQVAVTGRCKEMLFTLCITLFIFIYVSIYFYIFLNYSFLVFYFNVIFYSICLPVCLSLCLFPVIEHD